MWCLVHVMHVVLCTRCIGGMMYIWRCLHIVHMVSCTCDVVHTLCKCYFVKMILSTCCTYGTSVYAVFCACITCCVVGM